MGEGLCNHNPVIGTNKTGAGEARDRVLSDAELSAIWKHVANSDYGRIVRLLMLTAQRRDEIGSLRWSEIEAMDRPGKALIALPGKRTKNGRPHDVPLSNVALDVLDECTKRDDRDLVFGQGVGGFSGWSKCKEDLDEKSSVKNWTLHDLRRTGATRMADSGVQPHVIEAVLNHVSGHKAGVAGVYNRAAYAAEKRAALDMLASYIKTALAQSEGTNVRRLKRGRAQP
jgi:integrase